MTGIDTLVIACMALALVVWLGEPLLQQVSFRHYDPTQEDEQAEILFLQKETVYTALRDLEFDFQTGKVDTTDYTDLRQQLEGDALHILRQIDIVDPLARLDQAIERRVSAVGGRHLLSTDESSASTCQQCSALLTQGDNYCPCCGHVLRTE